MADCGSISLNLELVASIKKLGTLNWLILSITTVFTEVSAVFSSKHFNQEDIYFKTSPSLNKSMEVKRMRRVYMSDTSTFVDNQEIAKFGGKGIEF